MEPSKEKLLARIGNNLRFVITISIFFLSLFTEIRLIGSAFVTAYIINYLIFEIYGKYLSERHLKWVSTSILVGIGSYIFPLFILGLAAAQEGGVIGPFTYHSFQALIIVSGLGMTVLPVATMLMLVVFPAEILKKLHKISILQKIDGKRLWYKSN